MLKSVKDLLQFVQRLLRSIILSDNDIYTVKVSQKKKSMHFKGQKSVVKKPYWIENHAVRSRYFY